MLTVKEFLLIGYRKIKVFTFASRNNDDLFFFPFKIKLTLLTCETTASSTSPMKGRNTMALYSTG